MNEFECLHTGFDTFEVNFQGSPGAGLRDVLADGKEKAQEAEEEITVTYKGHVISIAPTGGAGFRYRFQCGYDKSETWFMNDAKSHQGWNMRVSVGSSALAVDGFGLVWGDIWQRLEDWGCFVLAHSIGRVDICADFAAEDFVLDPAAFVAHWRTTNKERADFDQADGVQIVRKGRRVTSVTLGMMPGRQVQVYDKRREVIDKQKGHWWTIWGVEKDTPVWRVEIRLGKRHLKDVWGVSTIDEFNQKLGDMLAVALAEIRLAKPGNDTNASRWETAEIWDATRLVMAEQFEPMGHDKKDKVQTVRRKEQQEKYMRQVRGLLAGAAVCLGIGDDALPVEFARGLEWAILKHITESGQAWCRSKDRAEKKFIFLEEDRRNEHSSAGKTACGSGQKDGSETGFDGGSGCPQIGGSIGGNDFGIGAPC